MTFPNRRSAGQQLASRLATYRESSAVVLALLRGGVPVAAEVANALSAPLGLVVVKKVGVPWQPEVAMGAVVDADPPVVVRNESVLKAGQVSPAAFEAALARAAAETRDRTRAIAGTAGRRSSSGIAS